MCYPCTHCNKCGAFPTDFMCPRCKSVQVRGADFCTECGCPLPKLPGMPNKAKEKSIKRD